MIDLNAQRDLLLLKLKEKEGTITQMENEVQLKEMEFSKAKNQIEANFQGQLSSVGNIYEDVSAKIKSGRIFTDEILDNVISAFRAGFIEYLPQYYAEGEVASRVKEIVQYYWK
jgi:hypothetical protein